MEFKTEQIVCDFCDESKNKPFDESEGWKIVECIGCGFRYTNPRPTEESLPHFYDQRYYLDNELFGESYSENGEHEVGHSYIFRVMELEHWFDKRGSSLEIGAARGGYVKALEDRGWKATGVDVSEYAVNIGKELHKTDIRVGTLESVKFDEKFDAISMYQVLEHVPSPKFVLEKCYELLNPGGVIVIEVPNLKSFDMKISGKRRKFSYDLPRHLSHFDPPFLGNELEKLGFSVLDVDQFHPNFILKLSRGLEALKSAIKRDDETPLDVANQDVDEAAKDLPLLRKNPGRKAQLIKSVSTVFPGWRFTITARK